MPPARRTRAADDERRWRQEGFQLVDRPSATLDAHDVAIEIPGNRLQWATSMQELLGEFDLLDRGGYTARPAGRFPIASWTLSDRPVTPAGRLVRAMSRVRNRQDLDGRALLGTMAELLDRLPDGAGIVEAGELRHWMRGR